MNIKIELNNNFYKLSKKVIKSTTSRNLTIPEANAIYSLIEKFLKKLCDKDPSFWDKEEETEDHRFFSIADFFTKEEDKELIDSFENDWIISD